jgi:diguanylate cyclase (GGDEF)-like protein
MDNFGMIDKRLGHAIGDEILTSVAKLLNSLIEEGTDFLCRYAGDEFAVLTTRPLDEAKQLAWKMISAIEEADWKGGIIVTGSAGIAGGRRKGIRSDVKETYTIADLINMASLSSTKAKKERQRVIVTEQMEIEYMITPDI